MKKITTSTLLTLSEILDTFESFNIDLEQSLSNEKYRKYINDVYKIYKLIKNEKTLFISRRTKDFYKKHADTLRLIHENEGVNTFIVSHYTNNGKIKEDSDIIFFYNYLMLHKDELETIQKLLRKIQELKIDNIEFDENLDFTKQTFAYERGLNSQFIQLEGMYLIPGYITSSVNYSTNGSHYAISCGYRTEISLNSLTFDADLLPKNISHKGFDFLIHELIEKEKNNIVHVRNSVNLNVGIEDLKKQFDTISKVINELQDGETKDNLVTVLLNMQAELSELQGISSEHDDTITKTTNISKNHLEDEKKLYYHRRFLDSIHWD